MKCYFTSHRQPDHQYMQNDIKHFSWDLNLIFELGLFLVLPLKKPTTARDAILGIYKHSHTYINMTEGTVNFKPSETDIYGNPTVWQAHLYYLNNDVIVAHQVICGSYLQT